MIVNRDLVTKLEMLITKVSESCPDAQPVIQSGYRTRSENNAQGQPEMDAHVRGMGVDLLFKCPGHIAMSLTTAQRVAGIAPATGFTSIEIDKGSGYAVHLDI